MEILPMVFIVTLVCFFGLMFGLFLILILFAFDQMVLLLAFLVSVSLFFTTFFSNFLFFLSLKIKSSFRETLRYEIDKNKKVYEFIKQRGKVTLEELVTDMEGVKKDDISFPTKWHEWEDFLKVRVSDFRTLEGDKSGVSLTEEVKNFFVFDNPSFGDLVKYIYFVYMKRQPYPFD